MYYSEACNEFVGPISVSLRPGNTTSFKEMSHSGGDPLATLCTIDLNLKPTAPEANASPLDQLAGLNALNLLYCTGKSLSEFV